MAAYYNDIDPFCCDVLRRNIERGHLPQGTVDDRDIRTVRLSELRKYRQWHLFAGIGGFPYGLRLAGVPDDFPILTGGFPCQPFSVAGKQRGAADDRHLWPAMFRAIAYLRPRWVCGENVPGIDGMELDQVLLDLESCGYEVAPPLEIPACAVEAWHPRARIWIVAHAKGERGSLQPGIAHGATLERPGAGAGCGAVVGYPSARVSLDGRIAAGCAATFADAASVRRERLGKLGQQVTGAFALEALPDRSLEGPRPAEWQPEPGLARLVHGVPRRVDRLRALGNAIVPQVFAELARFMLAAQESR